MAKQGKAKRARKYPAETSAPPRRTVTISRLFDRRTGEPVGMAESTDWSDVERELDAWVIGALTSPEAKAGSEAGGLVIVRGMADYPGGSFHPSVIEQVRVWVYDAVARAVTGKGKESKSFPPDFGRCEIEIIYKSKYDIIEQAAGLRKEPATEPEQVTRPIRHLRGPHFTESNEQSLNTGNESSEHLEYTSSRETTTEGSKLSEGSPEEQEPGQPRIEKIGELLAESNTADFGRLVNTLRAATNLVRDEVIAQLQDGLNKSLNSIIKNNFNIKKSQIDNYRNVLSDFNVAIHCPATHLPSKLYAVAPSQKNPRGQFWIRPKGSSKATVTSTELADLLPLKLMDIGPRREPLAEWHIRVKEQADPVEERGR